jgi:hypothetical protein
LICNTTNEELGSVRIEEVRTLHHVSSPPVGECGWIYTLMTIDGRSAAAAVDAKRAPLSAAAAIEANPKDFMISLCPSSRQRCC